MQLHIHHETLYCCAEPVKPGIQNPRLTPPPFRPAVLSGGTDCRLAPGRGYLDACPIRGVRRGGGAENMRVDVSVQAAAQQQQ